MFEPTPDPIDEDFVRRIVVDNDLSIGDDGAIYGSQDNIPFVLKVVATNPSRILIRTGKRLTTDSGRSRKLIPAFGPPMTNTECIDGYIWCTIISNEIDARPATLRMTLEAWAAALKQTVFADSADGCMDCQGTTNLTLVYSNNVSTWLCPVCLARRQQGVDRQVHESGRSGSSIFSLLIPVAMLLSGLTWAAAWRLAEHLPRKIAVPRLAIILVGAVVISLMVMPVVTAVRRSTLKRMISDQASSPIVVALSLLFGEALFVNWHLKAEGIEVPLSQILLQLPQVLASYDHQYMIFKAIAFALAVIVSWKAAVRSRPKLLKP